MIGLAWDIQDSRTLTESRGSGEGDSETAEEIELRNLQVKYRTINPSVVDIICFSFCYIGALTGNDRMNSICT